MMIARRQHPIAGPWRKSSHSGSGNNCIEVAPAAGGCAVRDSKDPHGARLAFAADAWKAFVADIKRGRYNDL
jgi:Domain of unknown function (DUF397)